MSEVNERWFQAKVGAVGRPVVHNERWSRATLILMDRQIVFLDRLSSDIRARSGAVVRRTEILRALINALASSGIEASGVRSEGELRELLLQRLAPLASHDVR